MKNIVLASVLGLSLISTAWATETVNIHERVNNAQAPAHQMQSSSTPAAIQGAAPRMAGMDQHEQAIIVHETMNNGSADAHKKMAESHQKMMGTGTVKEGANKQVISSQADSLIKISRIWADFFPANTSNQPI